MAIIFPTLLIDFLMFNIFVFLLVYIFYQYRFQFWKKHGIFFLTPSFPLGNVGPIFTGKEQLGIFLKRIYEETKQHNFIGIYFLFKKCIVINDLDLIKHVVVKEFNSFNSHGLPHSVDNDPLGKSLFVLEGKDWKNLRTKIAPSFTANKMRYIFDSMVQCTERFTKQLERQTEKSGVLEFKEIFAQLGTNIIASCAFGIELDCFNEPNTEFRRMGKKQQDPTFKNFLALMASIIFPTHVDRWNVKLTSDDIEKFFMKIVKETIKFRDENNVVRQDMMQLLIDLYKKDKEAGADDPFTVEDIAAQANFFFIAGFDTSSSAGCFALYELAKNPEVQDRLREEVLRVLKKHDGKLTFEVLSEMTYLGWVIEETLRMYPSAPAMIRICTKDCKLPGTEHIIEKGTRVMIPALGIQWDPDLYPEPEKFIPERFSNENKQSRHAFAYLAFGEGPRICMGVRFAMMQLKISILSVIKNFEISMSEKTLDPMVYDAFHIFLIPKSGLYLNLKRLDN